MKVRAQVSTVSHLDKCIACGLCVRSCPPQAMKLQA